MFSGRDFEIDSKISIDIRDINKYYNFLMPEHLRNYGVLNCTRCRHQCRQSPCFVWPFSGRWLRFLISIVVDVVIKRANRIGEEIFIQVQYLIHLSNYPPYGPYLWFSLSFIHDGLLKLTCRTDQKSVVVYSIPMILITIQFKCHMIREEESMCLTWPDKSRVSAQGFHDVEEYRVVR
jgi:hypothetical protein